VRERNETDKAGKDLERRRGGGINLGGGRGKNACAGRSRKKLYMESIVSIQSVKLARREGERNHFLTHRRAQPST